MSDEQGCSKCRRRDHGREGGKRLTNSEPVKPEAISWCSQHGAEREKADEIAVDEARSGERNRIDALLHHDIGHAAASREQEPIAEDEPTKRGGDSRKGYANCRKCSCYGYKMWCGKPAEQQGAQIGANCKEHSRYAEHRRKISATRMNELLQWCQKDAEGIDRAKRQAQDGSGGEDRTAPRSRINLFPRHVRIRTTSPLLFKPNRGRRGAGIS